jgi:Flp pilus assembly pilin Flp
MNPRLTAGGLREMLKRLWHSERGQGLVEYALIIVVVSLGVIASLTFLRNNIRGLFSTAGSSIALGAGSGGGSSTPPAATSPPVQGTGGQAVSAIACSTDLLFACLEPGTASVSPGTWGGTPTPGITYQWASNANVGAACNTTDVTTNGWSSAGTTQTVTLPNITQFTTVAIKVIVTATNTDPGSPVKIAKCYFVFSL